MTRAAKRHTRTPEEERVGRLTALKLPVASAHVDTTSIDAALRDLALADQQTDPKQLRLYLERAKRATRMAWQSMISAQGEWREYNDRADALIRELTAEGREVSDR